jgi:hypothetical protein
MVSRQHFEMVAATIQEEREALQAENREALDPFENPSSAGLRALDKLAVRFADKFEAVNPRFSRSRFFTAAGVVQV